MSRFLTPDGDEPEWYRLTPGPATADESLPQLSLEDYRQLIRGTRRPSASDQEAFYEYFISARSWYKHLPLIPPGRRVTFFFDPCAMMLEIASSVPDRRCLLERPPGESEGHYAAMPTLAYRQKFGCLEYHASEWPPAVSVPTSRDRSVTLATLYRPPAHVLELGAVEMTGVIAPWAATPCAWKYVAGERERYGEWSAEGGGPERLREILAFCAANEYRGPECGAEEVPHLAALLADERAAQRGRALAAIERVTELVWG